MQRADMPASSWHEVIKFSEVNAEVARVAEVDLCTVHKPFLHHVAEHQ